MVKVSSQPFRVRATGGIERLSFYNAAYCVSRRNGVICPYFKSQDMNHGTCIFQFRANFSVDLVLSCKRRPCWPCLVEKGMLYLVDLNIKSVFFLTG